MNWRSLFLLMVIGSLQITIVTSSCTRSTCHYIESFYLDVTNRWHAGTSGSLRVWVKQGSRSCATIRYLFHQPGKNQYKVEYEAGGKFGSCAFTKFDVEKAIYFKLTSTSRDDCYVDWAGFSIGGQTRKSDGRKIWRGSNDFMVVNKRGSGTGWLLARGHPRFALWDSNGNTVGAGVFGLLISTGGTVCNDYFTDNAADAICRKMGYLGHTIWSSGNKWSIQNGLPITLDNVNCGRGDWNSCTYNYYEEDCSHNQDIFLLCDDGLI